MPKGVKKVSRSANAPEPERATPVRTLASTGLLKSPPEGTPGHLNIGGHGTPQERPEVTPQTENQVALEAAAVARKDEPSTYQIPVNEDPAMADNPKPDAVKSGHVHDRAPAGGRFHHGGRMVNSNGEPV